MTITPITIKEFISRTWWTTNIAVIRENDPRRHGDLTLKQVKEIALYYGIADEFFLDEELMQSEVEGFGNIRGRLVITIKA
jgi:hypothetical protein